MNVRREREPLRLLVVTKAPFVQWFGPIMNSIPSDPLCNLPNALVQPAMGEVVVHPRMPSADTGELRCGDWKRKAMQVVARHAA